MNKFFAVKSIEFLSNAEFGSLEISDPWNQTHIIKGNKEGYNAKWIVKHPSVFKRALLGGSIGLGETYIEGLWETDNLTDFIGFFTSNENSFIKKFDGSILFKTLNRIAYLLQPNSIKGSRKNIHAHYDLGNDFYQLWLDPTMTYSAALYNGQELSLEEAQKNKYQRILNELQGEELKILEIGCGWGGFYKHSYKNKHSPYSITISNEQYKYAKKQIEEELSHIPNMHIQDYRMLKDKFDAVVSIEMMEAVGEKYWDVYFQKIKECLKEKGKAVIQVITIRDDLFDSYRKSSDFIKKHIFPGGMLISDKKFKETGIKNQLKVINSHNFGLDYFKTLENWLINFENKINEVKELGYSENFIRKWRFYLAFCMAAFRDKRIDVFQYTLTHV